MTNVRFDFIYSATRETQTPRSTVKRDVIYLDGEQIWRDHRDEPWIFDLFKTLSNVYSYWTLKIGHGARGRERNRRRVTSTIIDVCTSDLPTAKCEQAFLLQDEQINGTSDTVGIQWLSNDEQQNVPRSWIVRAAEKRSPVE